MKELRFVFSYIIVQLSLLFIFSFILMRLGYDPNQISVTTSQYQWLIVLILGLIFIPILYKNYEKKAENNKKTKISNVFPLILFGISLSILYNSFIYYLNDLFHFTNLYDGTDNIITTIFCTGLVGPVIEEYMFRGIMYSEYRKKYSVMKSILITTTIFALLHFTLIQMIYAFAFGFILLYVYEKYKNIKAPILMHMASNITTTIMVFILNHNYFILNYLLFLISLFVIIYFYIKYKEEL